MSDEETTQKYVEKLLLAEVRRANRTIGFKEAEDEFNYFDVVKMENKYKAEIEQLEKQILKLEDTIKVLRKRGPH